MVLCAGAFGGYAAQGSLPGAQGQGYDLNLSYSRTTLKAVADAITQQAGIAFSYETALAGYPMENLEVSEKGATIEAILATVFTPRGIDYRVVDKVVVLTRSTRPVPAARAAAKSEVKGVVRDAAGNPMIGVTVTIKGTLVGVSTGVDGGYAIPADGNATLLFSYIGYRPHEEVVGRRTQIDVTMQEDELVMDEVVVVGYGTLKKRNIVGAVENLSGDAVENRPNANITRSLQGQIPGLNIVQVDGKADHAGEVTIRGVNNTFKARVSGGEKTNKLGQGGGALVLIDGAEGDMGSVNPDDIASISVLKDASSAAVYGARGAFGVILITTKDPEKGKVRVSYNGSVSLHRRTVIWEDNVVTDPVQWVDAFRESYLNSSPTATVPSLFNFRNRGGGRHGQHLPHLEAPDRLHRLLTLPLLKAMPRPEKGAAFFLPVHRRGCRHVASRAQVPPPALREPRRRPYTAAFRPGRSIPAFGLREVVISAHGRLRDGP